jgi:hypothetical protein
MSNFFQTSIKKEKLNRSKNNDNKISKEKDKNANDISNKKKNTKKFLISPVKEVINVNYKKYEDNLNSNNSNINNEHIFNNINEKTPFKLSYNNNNKDNDMNDINKNIENTLSFKNKYISPLYTNTNNLKKSISSTLSYEPLYNLYDNINENDYSFNNKNEESIDISNNINNNICKKIENTELNKTNNKNYTSINKLNFTSLSNEPTLTYILKDKLKIYNYNIMLDTNTGLLINISCNIPCHYCRRKFSNLPLGIPIKYYPSLYILSDNSFLSSKYSFNYKENTIKLNKNEKERLLNILKNNPDILYENNYEIKKQKKEHKIITKNFFETDGIVCSFNCMVSYIEENSYNPLYQNSYNYSYLMYKHIFGKYPNQPFIRSPSWKLRKEYGGPLDDDDYDKFIQFVPIVESKQIKTINNNIKPELIFEVLI